jgi:hypothetical protein
MSQRSTRRLARIAVIVLVVGVLMVLLAAGALAVGPANPPGVSNPPTLG